MCVKEMFARSDITSTRRWAWFEIEEDSCIVEAKVGPYLDERDKVRL